MSQLLEAVDVLRRTALSDGGWGYHVEQPLHIEPTCLALLALSTLPDPPTDLLTSARRALDRHADGTGLYRLDRGRREAVWPSAMVLFARAALGESRESLRASAERLIAVRGLTINGDPELSEMYDIDPTRVGWPWAEGTFAWVEPTAWAVLALRRCGFAGHPRVIEGARLLLDRSFDEGGINYGNRIVLGAKTEPIPGPTALMLLAMVGRTEPRVSAAEQYLRSAIEKMHDIEHLGWGKAALDARGADTSELANRLRSAYADLTADGRPLSIVRHALAALASADPVRSPFRWDGSAESVIPMEGPTVPPAKPQDPPKPGLIESIKAKFRNVMVRGLGALRQMPQPGTHIAAVPTYDDDIAAVLKSQFDHFRTAVPLTGKRVLLKPNLVEFRKAQVINTDPRFIDAVIRWCREEGAAEVVVAEGPGHWRNVEFLVEESGLGAVLRRHGVRFVDLNHDEPAKVPNLGRTTGLEHLYLTRTVLDADVFISLPKMKTHHWAGATLSLKNLFGTVPGICYGWPKNELHWRGIPNSIVDIALTHTPHLAIVDGITAMEGDGPLAGKARSAGVVVMGADLVSVDATCCRLMGLPAERLPTLALAAAMKLGRLPEAEIPQFGRAIAERAQKFEWPPKLEKWLIPVKTAS